MSNSGPKQKALESNYSAVELRIFRALAVAQSTDDDARVGELVLELSKNGIDKSRYNKFVEDIKECETAINVADEKLAAHDAQIDAHRQDIAYHQDAAAQKVNSYAPGYQAAVDQTMSGRPAAQQANNNQKPKKSKSRNNCTIL